MSNFKKNNPPHWRGVDENRRSQLYKTVEYLALRGFHAQTIAEATGLSKHQISNATNRLQIRLRDYRDGKGRIARQIIVQVQYAKVI